MSLYTPSQKMQDGIRNMSIEGLQYENLLIGFAKVFTIPFIVPMSISKLSILQFENQMTTGTVYEIVKSIDQHDYELLVSQIEQLKSQKNFGEIFTIVDKIENAFSISKLIVSEPLIKTKIENMQIDLLQIKGYAERLSKAPYDDKTYSLFTTKLKEIQNKFESSKYLHDFLKSIGTSEEEVLKSIRENSLRLKRG